MSAYTLTTIQTRAVEDIVVIYKNNNIREVHFKAPTGSGKTLMATHFISQIINQFGDGQKLVFIIATISNADLPKSFETKINEYKQYLPNNNFEVEHFVSPSNNDSKKKDASPKIALIQNKVYIFGKATFGKGRIFTEQETITDFVKECRDQGYNIIYIRDEAHIGTGKASATDKTFEKLMNESCRFILKMTATFDNKSTAKRVSITENDLNDENKNDGKFLLKTKADVITNDAVIDSDLIDLAIEKFKEIKNEYNTLIKEGVVINPAMLIQVDNEKSEAEASQNFHSTLQLLKDKIQNAGLSWVQYFGDSKACSNVDNTNFTLEKISRLADTTDCIIFKVGPATGWDIPRACMLLQLRNICSTSLKIQTIGRIKRNPYPNLVKNDITDKYYIFDNSPEGNNKDYTVFKYTVKDEFIQEQFASIQIVKNGGSDFDENIANEKVAEFLQGNKKCIIEKYKHCFKNNQFYNQDKKLLIKNVFSLLRHIEIEMRALKPNQRKVVEKIIEHDFDGINKNSIKAVLLNFFINDIRRLAKECGNLSVGYQLTQSPINPSVYYKIIEKNDKNSATVDDNNKYLFDIHKLEEKSNIEYFDSSNEPAVFNTLQNYFNKNDNVATVWAKNPHTSNIYGEYLDEDNYKRRSYFDFVVKFANGNYLYIEVKGQEDIDLKKTENLKKAYQDYFTKAQDNLQTQSDSIFICVITVSNNSVTRAQCYCKQGLNEEYNLNEILQHITANS
jgi:type III restriction enzyme